MAKMLSSRDIENIIQQQCDDPFKILGPHIVETENKKQVAIRCWIPRVDRLTVCSLEDDQHYPMNKVHPDGFFECVCDHDKVFSYQLEVTQGNSKYKCYDCYSFPSDLSSFDIHLMGEGRHYETYEKLGAHVKEVNGVKGVHFVVWAPHARSISIIGSFNQWLTNRHQMRNIGGTGVWELFIPELKQGEIYKYRILTPEGNVCEKSDPYAFYAEISPQTASRVWDLNSYEWNDQAWVKSRPQKNAKSSPMLIYEMHLGSWKRKKDNGFLTYRELAPQVVEYVKEMGYTHIELMPICEHPYYGSWGYQVTGYYAPTSRYGTPQDFMYFVDYCHQNSIGVILDWVPAHFPKDAHGLGFFDGTHLYEHPHSLRREHPDWKTFIFNYGKNEVKNYLISNVLFWTKYYHIDGFRVDAVASMLYLNYSRSDGQWLPNEYGGSENLEAIAFMRELNNVIEEQNNGVVVIAEDSTSWPGVTRSAHAGGLGFNYKWNMGWMNDILKYMATDPIYRKYEHNTLSFSIWYAFNENFILPLSHDEVVHLKKSIVDKMSGDLWQKFANLRLLYGYMYAHPGKKMLFMGSEFAQWREWNHERALDWFLLEHQSHRQVQQYIKDLNRLCKQHPSMYELDHSSDGFEWIDYHDADNSIIAFFRKSSQDQLMFVFNFTPIPRENYQFGVPFPGTYKEIFNSDSHNYGGSNIGNLGEIQAEEKPLHNRKYRLSVTLPPLSMIILQPQNIQKIKEEEQAEKDIEDDDDETEEKGIDRDKLKRQKKQRRKTKTKRKKKKAEPAKKDTKQD